MTKSVRRKLHEISREVAYSAEENARVILEERTRHLAARRATRFLPETNTSPVLICGAGAEHYGIPLGAVSEVLPAQTCIPIPDSPPALVGLLGRRGKLVSVIDLATVLAIPTSSDAMYQHLILLRREHPCVALRVERAHGVASATPLAPTEGLTFRNDAVIGYAESQSDFAGPVRILSMLDVERLIRPFLSSFPDPGV